MSDEIALIEERVVAWRNRHPILRALAIGLLSLLLLLSAAIWMLDSGPGPSAEIEGKLFEPFATSKPEGVGLGLAVARQIARAHEGDLVYSRNGAGTTCFELRLPLA